MCQAKDRRFSNSNYDETENQPPRRNGLRIPHHSRSIYKFLSYMTFFDVFIKDFGMQKSYQTNQAPTLHAPCSMLQRGSLAIIAAVMEF